jgi:hypothetical protein
MRRALLPILILAAIAVASAMAWFTLTRGGGSGGTDVTSEVRAVDAFHRIDVNGHANVTLNQGSTDSVTVVASSRGQPRVRARVENGVLVISAGDRRRWWDSLFGGGRGGPTPQITIAFKSLDRVALAGAIKLSAARIDAQDLHIAASGGSTVRIDDLQAQSLRIAGSGALKATLAGKVVDQTISISGAGDVRADRLASENAKVSVSGAGSVIVNAEKTLRASISGAGVVEYFGNPEVKQSVSGVGRVKRRQTADADGWRIGHQRTPVAL